MPRAKPAERIRSLQEQRARITAEIQRVRSRESREARKRETRRRMLAGAMAEAMLARGEWSEEEFRADMDRFLERDRDRALFGLPPRPPEGEAARQNRPPSIACTGRNRCGLYPAALTKE